MLNLYYSSSIEERLYLMNKRKRPRNSKGKQLSIDMESYPNAVVVSTSSGKVLFLH